jgi:hypothetical protein
MDDWAALYKLGRLGLLALTLLAIGIYVYAPSRRERLEAPARRMLEDDQ